MVLFEGTLLEFRSQTFPARSWDIGQRFLGYCTTCL